MSTPAARHPAAGMALGVLAVALFGATLPITRWTLGSADVIAAVATGSVTGSVAGAVTGSFASEMGASGASAAMSPLFITFSRVVLAAAVSALCLLALRARWPTRQEWGPLAVAAAGNAVLYPLSLAIALQSQSAAHVAVITALLPLATAGAAAVAAMTGRLGTGIATNTNTNTSDSAITGASPSARRGHRRFWLCAVASAALVAWFSLRRSGQAFTLATEDLIVACGVVAASLGYVQGAKVTRTMGAERVICWVTLLTLPVSLPMTVATWPAAPVPAGAWVGLTYLGLVSMWAAFFAWYRALDWGGPLKVSQTQAFQPFFSMALAWPLLGERPDALTLAFAAAVVGLVALGTRR